MYTTSAILAVLSAAAAVSAQGVDPSINTPTGLTQCQNSALTFAGSQPPFTISAIPGKMPGTAPIEDIAVVTSSPYTWKCNLAEGTFITLQIRDNVGNLQYSGAVSVLGSSDRSCIGNNTVATNTSGSPASPTVSNSGATQSSIPVTGAGTSSTPAAASSSSPTSRPATSATTSAVPTSTTSNAASALDVKFGITGAIALLVGALFA